MRAKRNGEMMAVKNDKNGLNRCPKCGATDVVLDASSGKLKCSFCRSLFSEQIENAYGGIEGLKGEIVGEGATNIIPDEKVILTLKCPACGAEVVLNADEVTSARCHWCRHVLSINEKIPNGAVPDLVLPFKLEKREANAKINQFVAKRQFFAHSKFKKEFKTDNVLGVYLPYVIVDINAHARLTGEAEHLVRQYTVGSGDDRETRYDADAYIVGRDFDLLVDDLTVEASADKLNQDLAKNTNNVINAILPYDTDQCVGWNPAYLRGFTSEKRDTNIDALKPLVRLQVEDLARYRARESMTFYNRGVKWDKENVTIGGARWKAAYLPVWLYSYYQADKKMLHYVAVNARTGETMGSVPINKARLLLVSAIVEVIGIFLGTKWLQFWLGAADSDDSVKVALLGLAGFTPGFIFYWLKLTKYRNLDKRHVHELETKSDVKNLKKTDYLVENRKGLRNAQIKGENGRRVTGVLARNNKIVEKMRKMGLDDAGLKDAATKK